MSVNEVDEFLDSVEANLQRGGNTKPLEALFSASGDPQDRSRDLSRERHDRDRERRHRAQYERSSDTDRVSRPGSSHGSLNDSRNRSRSRDDVRFRSRRDRYRNDDNGRHGGDYYRREQRDRYRSRSPPDHERPYREREPPSSYRRHRQNASTDSRINDMRRRSIDEGRNTDYRNGEGRRRSRDQGRLSDRNRTPDGSSKPAKLTDDERDKRTVFVQQLAARLKEEKLVAFFERVGPVNEAQIVKDRVSGRSKGVGYVEFKNEDTVEAALALTGQKLLGIPIIVQHTEAEKNRQVRTEGGGHGNGTPYNRLYVGNIHFSITESDLEKVFEPFGQLEFVQLQREGDKSKGYGFVQFEDHNQAKDALEKMNGFDLAGRPIRVGLGNDKMTSDNTPNAAAAAGPSFSGAGGRGIQAGGNASFDRANGREAKGAGGASALDDADVAGVNFNRINRDDLMRKLARTDESNRTPNGAINKPIDNKPAPAPTPRTYQPSRCIVIKNSFVRVEEDAKPDNKGWEQDMEADVKEECEAKFGRVVHIQLEPDSDGEIYVKFDTVTGGENAIKSLNGRWFNSRMMTAQPVVEAVYGSLYAKARAL